MKKILLFSMVILLTGNIAFPQKRTLLGINITSYIDYYSTIKPEIGFVFERQFTKHSGFEMDLNYRTYQNELYLLFNNQSFYPMIIDKYFSIPILYKFNSKILKAGIGLTFDYNLGREQKNATTTRFIYESDHDYYVGPIIKLSKEFHLDNTFILEPELKANLLVLPFERFYVGLGIHAKFDLHKD